jgi:3'-phosphoadenosine 5'-phosphosulfate sulfotransferase (PAPS reductase)/FAD synthetase
MIPEQAKENTLIFDAFAKMQSVLEQYSDKNRIMASISGGSDSDIMLDMCMHFDKNKEMHYVFFDTGIEYEATKRHLDYLDKKYGIEIERVKAVEPVPLAVKNGGLPFISKAISQKINRAIKKGFCFSDDLDDTKKLNNTERRWWTNDFGGKSKYDIKNNYGLKEFLIENPPDFKISDYCCFGAKKHTAIKYEKDNDIILSLSGMRRAEGGARVSRQGCFNNATKSSIANYTPLWWLSDKDKQEYEQLFNIVHSDCYTVYGFKRTGCAGCPFNSKFETALKIIEKHEPKLFKAVNAIFGKSYEYTRKYRAFKRDMKRRERLRIDVNQISMYDLTAQSGKGE